MAVQKLWKLFNLHENLYTLGFWIADFEYVIRFSKFKMAVPIWRFKILKIVQFLWEFVYTGFLGRWFWMRCQIFEIQNGGPKFWKLFKFHENLYTLGYWIADFEYAVRFSKFKMAVPICRFKIVKIVQFPWKFVYPGFLDRWFWIRSQIFEIHNGGSN